MEKFNPPGAGFIPLWIRHCRRSHYHFILSWS